MRVRERRAVTIVRSRQNESARWSRCAILDTATEVTTGEGKRRRAWTRKMGEDDNVQPSSMRRGGNNGARRQGGWASKRGNVVAMVTESEGGDEVEGGRG